MVCMETFVSITRFRRFQMNLVFIVFGVIILITSKIIHNFTPTSYIGWKATLKQFRTISRTFVFQLIWWFWWERQVRRKTSQHVYVVFFYVIQFYAKYFKLVWFACLNTVIFIRWYNILQLTLTLNFKYYTCRVVDSLSKRNSSKSSRIRGIIERDWLT